MLFQKYTVTLMLILTGTMIIPIHSTFAQSLSSARGSALAALTAASADFNSLDWNPAGLSSMQEWEAGFSNYMGTGSSHSGLTLHSLGAGKKLTRTTSLSIRYSPDKTLEFIAPAVLRITDTSGTSFNAKFDRTITHHQRYSLGLGFQPVENFSVGMSAKYFETNTSDTRYTIDSNNAIQAVVEDYTASLWSVDAGARFQVGRHWTLGLDLRNLAVTGRKHLPEGLRDYELTMVRSAAAGAAYTGIPKLLITAELDTRKNLRAGAEWNPLPAGAVRAGLYFRNLPNVAIEARSVGIGYTWKPVTLDLSYISFLPSPDRSGSVPAQSVASAELTDIDYTPFTADRIMLTASVFLPRARESLAKIEYVEMMGEIFTAARQVYAFRPVGKARVRNVSPQPIDAKISFYIDNIMSSPTETKPYRISPDELQEIPFYAVLDERAMKLNQVSVFDGTVYVHAEVAPDYDDSYQTRVLVRGRNDWDGDVLSLRYFATPADPEILKFTRGALEAHRSDLDSVQGGLQNFRKAGILFDEFARHLTYVHDPMTSREYVQYPSETLVLRGGDCDDLAVCYATLLMSIGVPTAFVDVIPPEEPKNAHVYMMFDSGLEAKQAPLVSSNPKRYAIRKNEKGMETVWIPLETTAIKKGFEEAWGKGAEQFYEDTEVHLGILKGWMRVVDLPSAL